MGMYSFDKGRPKCWICNDSGFVLYVKKVNGFEYDFALRCKCIKGQRTSSRIGTIDDVTAECMARENYTRYGGKNSQSL